MNLQVPRPRTDPGMATSGSRPFTVIRARAPPAYLHRQLRKLSYGAVRSPHPCNWTATRESQLPPSWATTEVVGCDVGSVNDQQPEGYSRYIAVHIPRYVFCLHQGSGDPVVVDVGIRATNGRTVHDAQCQVPIQPGSSASRRCCIPSWSTNSRSSTPPKPSP